MCVHLQPFVEKKVEPCSLAVALPKSTLFFKWVSEMISRHDKYSSDMCIWMYIEVKITLQNKMFI